MRADSDIAEVGLVERSRRGDADAFNLLVEKYQQQVYNFALRMLGSAEAAADVTQEAFLSAFRNMARFRGGSFRGWLFRIVSNACYDELRSRQRQPSTSLEALMEDSGNPIDFPNGAESPEDRTLRLELAWYLQRALQALPPDQRMVVLLCDVHGLSYEEIAEVTGTNLGTVKSRLSRGRAHLRDYLRQHSELLPSVYRQRSSDDP